MQRSPPCPACGQSPAVVAAGFPWQGAVLNTANTRQVAETEGYILTHSESRLILGDPSTAKMARAAAATAGRPVVILDGEQRPDLLHGPAALPDDLMGRVTDEW